MKSILSFLFCALVLISVEGRAEGGDPAVVPHEDGAAPAAATGEDAHPVLQEVSHSASMGFNYPFDTSREKLVMTSSATVQEGKLSIGLKQEPGFDAYSMRFGFKGVMDGTEPKYKDSDSAQVAVVWKDKDGNVIGHSTNATSNQKKRDPKHAAALWTSLSEKEGTQLGWDADIPKGAVSAQIVLVYTDTLTNTAADGIRDKRQTARNGDLPLIIASFSAKLENGSWKMTANPQDVENTRKFKEGSFPKGDAVKETVTAVRELLQEKTGYKLIQRPRDIEGILTRMDKPQEETRALINKAVERGHTGGPLDSGFDIELESFGPVAAVPPSSSPVEAAKPAPRQEPQARGERPWIHYQNGYSRDPNGVIYGPDGRPATSNQNPPRRVDHRNVP